jgi:hypothetical protein
VLTEQASSEKGSRGRLGQPSQSRVPQSSRRAAAGPGGRYAPRRMSSGRALAVLPTLRLQNSPPAQPADVEPGNAAAHTPSSLARCRGPTPVTQPWGGTTEAPPSTASDWLSRCHHVAGKLTVCACVRVCVCQGVCVCVCVCVCVYACGVWGLLCHSCPCLTLTRPAWPNAPAPADGASALLLGHSLT